MCFSSVTLSDNSSLAYSLSLQSPKKGGSRSRILAVHIEGEYRIGCNGASDAYFIIGIVQAAVEIWHPSALVLDLRKLSYQWGDEMDMLLGAPEVQGILPFAVVGSDLCLPAISTLIFGIKTPKQATEHEGIFDDFESATQYLEKLLSIERQKYEDGRKLYTVKKRWGFMGWQTRRKGA